MTLKRIRLTDLSTNKTFACGPLPWSPDWVDVYSNYVTGTIDGEEVLFYSNYYTLSSTVAFFHQGQWHYFSNKDLSYRISRGLRSLELAYTSQEFAGIKRKPRKYVLSHLYGGKFAEITAHGEKHVGETNDCTVRAYAATTGKPYDEAHEIMSKFRKHRKGFPMAPALREHFTHEFKEVTPDRKMTVGTFARLNPRGRFVLLVSRHALSLVDGKIYDWNNSVNRKIVTAFEYIA